MEVRDKHATVEAAACECANVEADRTTTALRESRHEAACLGEDLVGRGDQACGAGVDVGTGAYT